jgi:hypothetical protein
MKNISNKLFELWDMCITISWQVELAHKLNQIKEELGDAPEGIPYPDREEWEINFIYAKLMITAWMYENEYTQKKIEMVLDYVNEL